MTDKKKQLICPKYGGKGWIPYVKQVEGYCHELSFLDGMIILADRPLELESSSTRERAEKEHDAYDKFMGKSEVVSELFDGLEEKKVRVTVEILDEE